jgi:uncharacterized protein
MTVTTTQYHRIVVAIDGSEASHSALVWGMTEALVHHAELHVLHAWQFAFETNSDVVETLGQEAIDTAACACGIDRHSICIHCDAVFGQPIPVILAAADDADLLVVGSHRHSQLGALFLGSVSQCLCIYSRCPVVVVHAGEPADKARIRATMALAQEQANANAVSSDDRNGTQGTLKELDASECRLLLGSQELGRLAVVQEGRPEIFPVNYVFDGDTVVFRTDGGTKFDWSVMSPVAFEVEDIDPKGQDGWVVEVRGFARDITDGGDPRSEHLRSLPLHPWVAGEKANWVAIVRPQISGRRLCRHVD